MVPFKKGKEYTRPQIYEILNVDPKKRKGDWHTGYHKHNGDWFIFCGIGTSGRTGEFYPNKMIGNLFEWYGRNNSKLTNTKIKSLLEAEENIFLFTRDDNRKPFTYIGTVRLKEYFNETPVRVLWELI